MPRQVRQTLPDPPPQYDQQYIASLARSINNYMGQAQALAEVITARLVLTSPPDTTVGQAVGTVYVRTVSGVPVLSLVLKGDP
jgi:hypothetical protein